MGGYHLRLDYLSSLENITRLVITGKILTVRYSIVVLHQKWTDGLLTQWSINDPFK